MELISVDIPALRQYLLDAQKPVMEIELLKKFTDYSSLKDLYQYHFSLAHALYRLKDIVASDNCYLHLNSTRIRLVKIPEKGLCGFYDEDRGLYCTEKTEPGKKYCRNHSHLQSQESIPLLDVLTGFYLDPENITFGSSELLEKLFRGILHMAFNRREVEQAAEMLGVVFMTREELNRRFREKVRIHHPDRGGDPEKMKEINRAYSLLKEVYGF